MLDLSMVTLLCVDARAPALATWAISKCLRHAGFAKTVLMTDRSLVRQQQPGIEYVEAPRIANIEDYSRLMLRGIQPHVSGTHVLVIQWDGFILNPDLWDPRFLDYDYIGAVWPQSPTAAVGNGGFSLRSRRLLTALQHPSIEITHPEDACICVTNRDRLESEFGIRFAPPEVADRFSVERSQWHPAFGFHGFFNFADALDADELAGFLREVPASCCGGLDSYHLFKVLWHHGRADLAATLLAKCRVRSPLWRNYLRSWLRLQLPFVRPL